MKIILDEENWWKCDEMRKAKKTFTEEEIEEDHEDCHGWYHCGKECCGKCEFCGV